MKTFCTAVLFCCAVAVISANNGDYEITIYTADEKYSGTNANVKIRLYGQKEISRTYVFPYQRSNFERNSVDHFIKNFGDLGEVFMVTIGHDGNGIWDVGSGWKLEKIEVQQKGSSVISVFPVNKWLDRKSGTYMSLNREPSFECGMAARSRVVNGVNSSKGQWPWQAQMQAYGRHNCGGTLIHPQYVLTASHCITRFLKNSSRVRMVLGQHDLKIKEVSEQEFTVKELIKHPHYDRKTVNNDIALIKLDRPAILNSDVKLACLPEQDEYLGAGKKCYITGWGRLFGGGNIPKQLQQAELPSITNTECQDKMKVIAEDINVNNNMVCGGGNKKSGCHGDSGGPYVCQKQDGRFTVQGAVSWGSPRCAVNGTYTVFARVGRYVDWIKSHINKDWLASSSGTYIKESEM